MLGAGNWDSFPQGEMRGPGAAEEDAVAEGQVFMVHSCTELRGISKAVVTGSRNALSRIPNTSLDLLLRAASLLHPPTLQKRKPYLSKP